MSLDVRAGLLAAQVQGSRAKPYLVTITTRAPSDTQWRKIDEAMRTRVGFAAQLLAGTVPAELEAVFNAANTNLLPSKWSDLDAACNCPDWENPCKHIGAVLYVFADQLDDDPWLLLHWRGRTRDQILDPLRTRAAREASGSAQPEVAPWWPFADNETVPWLSQPIGVPIGLDAEVTGERVGVTEPAEPPDAVLARCETLDITVRGTAVSELLYAAYESLARHSEAGP